jgi:hypothetical protein
VAKRVEQFGIEVPPFLGTIEIADVAAVSVVGFVRKQPPCEAKAVSCWNGS